MRPIISFLLCLLPTGFLMGQNLYDVNKIQTPTYNELAKYVDYPVSYSTGLPNISYNLLSLPTRVDDLGLDISMSYHADNISFNNSATDLGLGWNLMGMGSISKSIHNVVDEFHDFMNPGSNIPVSSVNYIFSYDDIYNYNFFGYSGKFKFLFDNATKTFTVLDISHNNLKIEFVNTNPNHLRVDSFIITDPKGYKYFFETKDTEIHFLKLYNFMGSPNVTPVPNSNNPARCYTVTGLFENPLTICDDHPDFEQLLNSNAFDNFIQLAPEYHPNYLISKVTDKNNEILYEYFYQAIPKDESVNSGNGWYLSSNRAIHKIHKIVSPGFGEIEFEFDCNLALRQTLNDVCKLNRIYTNNIHNQKIKEVSFINSHPSNEEFFITNPMYGVFSTNGENINSTFKLSHRRMLSGFEIKGSTNQIVKKYDFHYEDNFSLQPNGIFKLDAFGFFDSRDSHCDIGYLDYEGITNKNSCTTGVLKRIDLPTGDSVHFDFESNTFSTVPCQRVYGINSFTHPLFDYRFLFENGSNNFDEQEMEDQKGVFTCDETQLELDTYYLHNPDNSSLVPHSSHGFSISYPNNQLSISFTITEANYYIFDMLAAIDNCPPELGGNSEPFVKFIDIGVPIGSTGIVTELGFLNPRTICPSKLRAYLTPGTYHVNLHTNCGAQGSVTISKHQYVAENQMKKYIYGSGIRLKRTYTTDGQTGMISNEKKFYYNFFDNPQKSSGGAYSKKFFMLSPYLQSIFIQNANSKVVYRNVLVEHVGKGYEKFYYYTLADHELFGFNSLQNGLLEKHEVFNENNALVQSTQKFYEVRKKNNLSLFEGVLSNDLYIYSPRTLDYYFSLSYDIFNDFISKEFSLSTTYHSSGLIKEKSITENNDVNFIASQTISFDSQGEKELTEYFYPHDEPQQAPNSQLINDHLIHQITKVRSTKNNALLSETKFDFGQYHSFTLPDKLRRKKNVSDEEVLNQIVHYDAFKRPLEMRQQDGTPVCFIYAYHQTVPVAKLENIHYNQIPAGLIQAIRSATDTTQNYSEQAVKNALNDLRTDSNTYLQKALITTYTYKPLVGITSVTDPRGRTQAYHYDTFNRLEYIKDHDGNLITEQEYKYRTQN